MKKLAWVTLFVGIGYVATGCAPPLGALHAQAQKDFGCPPSSGIIDTRTEAKPMKFGSSQRMSIQGCGHKAIYHWDKDNDVWVREPDANDSANAKP